MEAEIIKKIELDFDALSNWRDPEGDNFPVLSCLSFYRACGLLKEVEQYCEKNDKSQVCAADNILCNFYTHQRIRRFIKESWEHHNICLKNDSQIEWKYGESRRNRLKHPKSISKSIDTSILVDVLNYGPGVDEDLEDNVLVFQIYNKEKEESKKDEQ